MGHGRQQAHRARLGLASGGHNYLARLPRVCELVAARKTRAHPHLGAQRAGRSDGSKDRTAQADARSRERGAHGAQITSRTAPGIPAHVRPAGEPASRGGTPAFTSCYSSMDGSRHRGGPAAGVGTLGLFLGRAQLLAPVGVELAKPPHTLLDRRVRDEHPCEPLLGERVDDVQRLGRGAAAELDELAGLFHP